MRAVFRNSVKPLVNSPYLSWNRETDIQSLLDLSDLLIRGAGEEVLQ